MFQKYANPTRFLKLANAILPWVAGLTVILIATGLYFAFAASPPDYQQGQTVRIMYVHVPSAWMAMFAYAFIVLASAAGLIWKHPVAHVSALAAAPIGACFTLICLTTGSLWGKPMWGTWWVWDARLTSVLVLFFLYLGFIALANAFDDAARGEKASAILALIGGVNLPIIKFSVDWWNTLHQPASVTKLGMPAVHSSMLIPLLLMAVGFTTLFFTLVIIRSRAELASRRVNALRAARIHAEASGG
ncbi:MAG: heme ABC transporter permease [Rhodospirillaceae bacterium]|nr:MAG: heme ABC transporter permease [Rhodospirillaceae bacterium]